MPDVPLTEAAPKAAPENSHKKSPIFARFWESPRFIAFTALAIALIAVAVAIAAWLLPTPAHFSRQQSTQAKTNVCSAYTPVYKAALVGKYTNARPGDPVGVDAMAANVRLAFLGGGAYLRDTLAANPATPADLAKAVDSLGNTLERLGLSYLAGEPGPVKQQLRKDLGSESAQINKMCAPKKK